MIFMSPGKCTPIRNVLYACIGRIRGKKGILSLMNTDILTLNFFFQKFGSYRREKFLRLRKLCLEELPTLTFHSPPSFALETHSQPLSMTEGLFVTLSAFVKLSHTRGNPAAKGKSFFCLRRVMMRVPSPSETSSTLFSQVASRNTFYLRKGESIF